MQIWALNKFQFQGNIIITVNNGIVTFAIITKAAHGDMVSRNSSVRHPIGALKILSADSSISDGILNCYSYL